MELSEDTKFWLRLVGILLGMAAVIVALSYASTPRGLHCAKCNEAKQKENVLVLHMKFGKQKLDIPYCPKCFVKILDDPETLTWAGNP